MSPVQDAADGPMSPSPTPSPDACPGNPGEQWDLLVRVDVPNTGLAPLVTSMVRHHAGLVAGLQFDGAYFAPCDADGHEVEFGEFSPWFAIKAVGPTPPTPEVVARVARIISNAALPAQQAGVDATVEVDILQNEPRTDMFPTATGTVTA